MDRISEIEGLVIIEPRVFGDTRGDFFETYHQDRYAELGVTADFVQDNVSISHKGAVRGMHCQLDPKAQAKLVQVLHGAAWDAVVDLRPDSPTFRNWLGIELSATNKKQMFVPRGCVHGFLSLEDKTIFSYKCDNLYAPETESGVRFDDPELGIEWPLAFSEMIISPKDTDLPNLAGYLDIIK